MDVLDRLFFHTVYQRPLTPQPSHPRINSGASLAVGLTFSFMHLLLLFQFTYNVLRIKEVAEGNLGEA